MQPVNGRRGWTSRAASRPAPDGFAAALRRVALPFTAKYFTC